MRRLTTPRRGRVGSQRGLGAWGTHRAVILAWPAWLTLPETDGISHFAWVFLWRVLQSKLIFSNTKNKILFCSYSPIKNIFKFLSFIFFLPYHLSHITEKCPLKKNFQPSLPPLPLFGSNEPCSPEMFIPNSACHCSLCCSRPSSNIIFPKQIFLLSFNRMGSLTLLSRAVYLSHLTIIPSDAFSSSCPSFIPILYSKYCENRNYVYSSGHLYCWSICFRFYCSVSPIF